MIKSDEAKAGTVREAKQPAGTLPEKWEWVEHSVWTERMLDALEKGVKGGVWFSLIDKVYRFGTLYSAWITVMANNGKPGTDHQSVEGFEQNLKGELSRLAEELRSGSYQPRPIRRVYINKPGKKEKRPLGIPCVRDRVVQAALRLVIEPIFENDFAPASYGFRPKRGCKDALREVDRLLKAGYTHVVDADLKAYFDSIPHKPLMAEVGRRIADGRVLGLIEGFLKQDIFEGMSQWTPEEGSPQGAVISPLLANIYLHPVDVAMAAAGYRMIRYADDFVILCRSAEEARNAHALVQHLTSERGLALHPEKTRLVDVAVTGQGFDFLGYHFEGRTRLPRKSSLKKLKDAIRSKTRRSNGNSLEAIIKSVNNRLRGWFEFFKHSNWKTFAPIDGWVRRRIRSILRKRIGLKGISHGLDHRRWPNQFFLDQGLFSLVRAHKSILQSSRR